MKGCKVKNPGAELKLSKLKVSFEGSHSENFRSRAEDKYGKLKLSFEDLHREDLRSEVDCN